MLMVIFLLFACQTVHATSKKTAEPEQNQQTAAEAAKQDAREARFTPEEIEAIAAALPDGKTKDNFLKGFASASEKKKPAENDVRTGEGGAVYYHNGASAVYTAKKRLLAYFTQPATQSGEWKAALNNINKAEGLGHLMLSVLVAALIVTIGVFAERMVKRATQPLRRQILEKARLGRLRFLGRVISNLFLNILGFATYMLTTYIIAALLYSPANPANDVIGYVILPSYYIKFLILVANFGLSPKAPALRLFPVQDEDAVFLHRWTIRLTVTGIVIASIAYLFRDAGIGEQHFFFLYGLSGLAVNFLLVIMLWRSRKRVARAIWPGIAAEKLPQGSIREKFARSWHFFAIAYVIIIGIYWFVNALTGRGAILELIFTLFLVPLFIGIDQWMQRLLKIATGELPEIIDLSEDAVDKAPDETPAREDIKHLAPVISTAFRVVLALSFFFAVLKLWGLDLPVGLIFTRTAFSSIGTLLLGYIGWQYIKTVIDRRLREEMPEVDVDMEEGGAGGSRTATLLMLLRKFVLAVLIVMISLIMLSSIGVNIAPLIAGAGVIGLAIGFGAQTLVKDIISGIFFLIDDAFRVGDYIETAGTKGMVEHISLRSLRLRHPRGPVFTIPFGGMGTVKNNSRDYIIEKLDFRVRYDTNVDTVRKIIKKINIQLQKNPELGPVLLDKIKSQGVRELDDSAMIMRVKFKTIPGEQFVVRREVFRMMQEAFRDNGIEFAHRNVTVYLPGQTEIENNRQQGAEAEKALLPDKKTLESAAAAAALAAEQADAEKQAPAKKK
jgi:small-conductance mechanosensitive channel